MRNTTRILAALLLAAPAHAWAADGSDANAEILSGPCVNCHGFEGTGAGAIPALRGRPAVVLLEQLRTFRDGSLAGTVMGRLAKGYSDDQLSTLATYFAAK